MTEGNFQRFVILEHDHPFLHWDLLMEKPDKTSLQSWRLLQKPQSAVWIASEALADHRVMYLDYEGPVSNDRGHVSRFDGGQFCFVEVGSEGGIKPGVESAFTAFTLRDCHFADRLLCRDYGQTAPTWRFE